MIWFLVSVAMAQFESYEFVPGKWTQYIVKPDQISSKEQFDRDFESYAISVKTLGTPLRHFPICSVNEKNRCECDVVDQDYSWVRTCNAEDGRRDIQGNCHLALTPHNCFVGSDLRVAPQNYEYRGFKVFFQHPYDYQGADIDIGGVVYRRLCHATSTDHCECKLRNKLNGVETECVSRTGLIPVDPAFGQCQLAVKTFADGSFVCFPINEPRPLKAELEGLKNGLSEKDYVGAIAMSFMDIKPDGIVMGYAPRPAEPKTSMITSDLKAVDITGHIATFRVPLSPFGKPQKHKLKFPNGLVTLTSCTLDGASLHLFIKNEQKCVPDMLSEREIYLAKACQVTIDMTKLKALYQQIKKRSARMEEHVCLFTPVSK